MFGEVELEGIKKLTLRKNGTIALPEFTRAEFNEILYYLELDGELRLYSEEEIKIVSNKIEKILYLKTDYEKARKLIRYLYACLIKSRKVLNSNRIAIPQKIIEKQHLESSIVFVGSENHAKIFKNMEEYQKYIERKKYN